MHRGSWSSLAIALLISVLPNPAPAYEVVPVTGGGAIQGTVVYRGAVSTRRIVPTKDREVCGAIREEPEVTVGPGQGALDAVVYLRKVERGKGWQKGPAPAELVNTGCVFVPRVQVVPAGWSLTIVNADPVMHNTHSFLGRATVFNIALPLKGQRVERPLKKEGLVRVECDAHGWMLAWVHVADNPYFDVTGKDGAFRLGDVPAGAYTLVAWHEYTGGVEVPVAVKAGETAKLTVELTRK